jgi:hypothetical protein
VVLDCDVIGTRQCQELVPVQPCEVRKQLNETKTE